jgi:pimeloyl-ACP methyl ester carboxylesterase
MPQVVSKDSTKIAYEKTGQGPAVVLVDGALAYRGNFGLVPLAAALSQSFTAYTYDRRGRGGSTDTQPYAVEREIEDIEALIDAAGGSAFVFGISSGAALAMEAAIKLGNKIRKLAMYEPPYNSDEGARQAWREYRRQLKELLEAGRRGDAVALFMMLTGLPSDRVPEMRKHPMWPRWEAAAPTLAYDAAVMGEDATVPIERVASVAVPTLVMDGGASYPFMHDTVIALANAIPDAQRRILEGQTHDVAPEVLALVLKEFFTD